MSAAQHTAGPWVRDAAGGMKGDVRGANGRWVALCWGLGNGDNYRPAYRAECDANARLIAAAPELLEALEMLLEFPNTGPATSAARAAIAKATGGAA